MTRIEQRIRDKAAELGFIACRFAAADAAADAGSAEGLGRWLGAQFHGEMRWMEERADQRSRPTVLWPEARSAIALAMSYAPADDPLAPSPGPGRGRISVYAQGRDYHLVMKKGLKALARWLHDESGLPLKLFVDTAPVMEKPIAAAAGLGWQGKHSNLLSREHGNWLFLGVILTALKLEPDPPEAEHCGSCTRCIDACPTAAIVAPGVVDARRCISYLTIELAGPIPTEFRRAIGDRIYGCDDCLAVCPWNKFADPHAARADFAARPGLDRPPLAELLALDDAGFRERFSTSPIKRIGVARFLRNCLVAAGNSGDPRLLPAIAAHQASADPVVADAARWALGQLAGTGATG